MAEKSLSSIWDETVKESQLTNDSAGFADKTIGTMDAAFHGLNKVTAYGAEKLNNLADEYLAAEDDDAWYTAIGKRAGRTAAGVAGGLAEGTTALLSGARDLGSDIGSSIGRGENPLDKWGAAMDAWKTSYDKSKEEGYGTMMSIINAIDENNTSDNALGELAFGLLNGPIGGAVGKGAKAVGTLIKGEAKNIGKQAAKQEIKGAVKQTAKKIGTVADDTTKAATKETAKEAGESFGKKLLGLAGKGITKFGEAAADVVLSKTLVDTTKNIVKGVVRGVKEKSFITGLREVLGSEVETLLKYAAPVERTMTTWTASTAGELTSPILNSWSDKGDIKELSQEYGYSVNTIANAPTQEDADAQYDIWGVPEEERLTIEQAKQKVNEAKKGNVLGNFLEGQKELFEGIDIFAHGESMYTRRRNQQLEVDRNFRGRVMGTSTSDSIDTSTTGSTISQNSNISTPSVTQNSVVTNWDKQIGVSGRETDVQWKYKDLKKNEFTAEINYYAENGMLTTETQRELMQGKTGKNFLALTSSINEGTKQYTDFLIQMYTPEELNTHPELQREVLQNLQSLKKVFNNVDKYLEQYSEDEIGDVRLEEVFNKSFAELSEKDKNNIKKGMFYRAIEYNNNLEEGANADIMNAALKMKQTLDSGYDDWFKRGFGGLASMRVDEESAGWIDNAYSAFLEARNITAQVGGTMLLNKVNDVLVEPLANKLVSKFLGNTKFGWRGATKAAIVEASSEPGEFMQDCIAGLKDPDHSLDFKYSIGMGMLQGAMGAWKNHTDKVGSIKDFISNPDNQRQILNDMGIYIDQIEDPSDKALMLATVQEIFDNMPQIIEEMYSASEDGAGTIAKQTAQYLSRKAIAGYSSDILNQVFTAMTDPKQTEEQKKEWFASERDYNRAQAGKSFNLNKAKLAQITGTQENVQKLESVKQQVLAYTTTAAKLKGATIQDYLDKMFPKVDKNGNKVQTTMAPQIDSKNVIAQNLNGNAGHDQTFVFMSTGKTGTTVGTLLNMDRNNSNVFGRKFGVQKYKKTVDVTLPSGEKKNMRMFDYLMTVINGDKKLGIEPAPMNQKTKDFLNNMFFQSTATGDNYMFYEDGSLTKLGEELLEQTLPEFDDGGLNESYIAALTKIKNVKKILNIKSRTKARKQVGIGTQKTNAITQGGQTIKDGQLIEATKDSASPFKVNGVTLTWGEVMKTGVQTEGKVYTAQQVGDKIQIHIITKTQGEAMNFIKKAEQKQKIDDKEKEIAELTQKATVATSEQGDVVEETPELKQAKKELEDLKKENVKTDFDDVPQGEIVDAIEGTVMDEVEDDDQNISINPEDYPDVENMHDVTEIVGPMNDVKNNLPCLPSRGQNNTGCALDPYQTEQLTLLADQLKLHPVYQEMEANFKRGVSTYTIRSGEGWPKVQVGDKVYSLVMFNYRGIEKETKKSTDTDTVAFYLVDFDNEDLTIDLVNNIRPKSIKDEKNKRRRYYHNTRACTLYDKVGNLVDEERILNFTYGYRENQKQWIWTLNTFLRLENLSQPIIDKKIKERKVFVLGARNDSDIHEMYIGKQKVEFDKRSIYTTSDIIFNDQNDMISIGLFDGEVLNIDIENKKFDGSVLEGKSPDFIFEYLNKLWGRTQDASAEGKLKQISNISEEEAHNILDEVAESLPKTETKQQPQTQIKQAREKAKENYNKVMEKAKEKNTDSTQSIAEVLNEAMPEEAVKEIEQEETVGAEPTTLALPYYVIEDEEEQPTPTEQQQSTVTEQKKTVQVEQKVKQEIEQKIEQAPTPTQIVIEENASQDQEIVEETIADPVIRGTILEDCKSMGISLALLPADTVAEFIDCYVNGKGLTDAINMFADKIPSTTVDSKFVKLLIEGGILKDGTTYEGLSLSQIIANIGCNKLVKELNLTSFIQKDDKGGAYLIDYQGNPNQENYIKLVDAICKYYSTNYLGLNYDKLTKALQEEIQNVIEKKLLDDGTFIMKPDDSMTLSKESDCDMFAKIMDMPSDIRSEFAQKALKLGLINNSECNYLISGDPTISVVGDKTNGIGTFSSVILDTIDSIPEFKEIKGKGVPQQKLQIAYDVYSYFAYTRGGDYNGLIKFLQEKYKNKMTGGIAKMIEIFREDSEKDLNEEHSQEVMTALLSSEKEDVYGIRGKFTNLYRGTEEQLRMLEYLSRTPDKESELISILTYAPKSIKDALYNSFRAQNQANKTRYLPIKIIGGMLNSRPILNTFKLNTELPEEAQKKIKDLLDFLQNDALVNTFWTKNYNRILNFNALNEGKGTVLYVSNGGSKKIESEHYSKYPIRIVSDLKELGPDVNVLYIGSLPDNIPESIRSNCVKAPRGIFVEDGMLGVIDYNKQLLETSNIVYNNFGRAGINIEHQDGDVQLTTEQLEQLEYLMGRGETYWTVFKNFVQPNIPGFDKITKQQFINNINWTKVKRAAYRGLLNHMQNCFVGNDLESMIYSACVLVNHITDGKYKIDIHSPNTIKSLDLNAVRTDFTAKLESITTTSKEKRDISNMFADYLLALHKKFDGDEQKWFDDFRTKHKDTLIKFYNKIVGEDVALEDLPELLFYNLIKDGDTDTDAIVRMKTTNKQKPVEKLIEINQQIEDTEIELERLKKEDASKELIELNENLLLDLDKQFNIYQELTKLDEMKEELNGLEHKEKLSHSEMVKMGKLASAIEEMETKTKYMLQEENVDEMGIEDTDNTEAIDIDLAKKTTVLGESMDEGSANKVFGDKAVKVLAFLKQNFIESHTVIEGSSTKINPSGRLVCKDLMDLFTGEGAFKSKTKITGKKKYREKFDEQNLTKLIQGLAVIKSEDPERYKEIIINDMFPYVGYGVGEMSENEDVVLLRECMNEMLGSEGPYALYNIFTTLTNNNKIQLLGNAGFSYETTTEVSPTKIQGLLKSAVKEFVESSPYVIKKDDGTTESRYEHVDEYHKKYDQYFDIKGAKPSDEQIVKMAILVDAYNNKDKDGAAIFIPGIAGGGKTTMITAFLRRVEDSTGALSEARRIKTGKQTSLIFNGDIWGNNYIDNYRGNKGSDGYFYIRLKSPTGGEPIVVRYKAEDCLVRYKDKSTGKIIDMITDDYNKAQDKEKFLAQISATMGNVYETSAIKDMLDLDEFRSELKDGEFQGQDNKTVYIKKVEYVDKVPDGVKVLDTGANYREGDFVGRKTKIKYPIKSGLQNITFASEKHNTTAVIKNMLKGTFGAIDTETIDHFFVQPDSLDLKNWGYSKFNEIRPEELTEGKVFIIDESQNTDDDKLQKFTDIMGTHNTIIFLGDFHQMGEGGFLEKNSQKGDFISETHRATKDLNTLNKINAFTQKSLIKAGAIGFYISDSNDVVTYDDIDNIPKAFDQPINDTLMVCKTNPRRQEINKKYIAAKGGMKKIIDEKKTLQVMIVDTESTSKENRNKQSEMPENGLNMEGFKESKKIPGLYIKQGGGKTQLFFADTTKTDTSESVISQVFTPIQEIHKKIRMLVGERGKAKKENNDKEVSRLTEEINQLNEELKEKNWEDVEIFVPAFAITTAKESGKTVNNIIVDEEITNSEYDFINESNVKQYYDATTRGAKHLYLPKKSTRLIGITKEQASKMMRGESIGQTFETLNKDAKPEKIDTILPMFFLDKGYAMDCMEKMIFDRFQGAIQSKEFNSTFGNKANEIQEQFNKCASLLQLIMTKTMGEKSEITQDDEGIAVINYDSLQEAKRDFAYEYKKLLGIKNGETNIITYINDSLSEDAQKNFVRLISKVDDIINGKNVYQPIVNNKEQTNSFTLGEFDPKEAKKKRAEARNKKTSQQKRQEQYEFMRGKMQEEIDNLLKKKNRSAEDEALLRDLQQRIQSVSGVLDYYETEVEEEGNILKYKVKKRDVDWEKKHIPGWIDLLTKQEALFNKEKEWVQRRTGKATTIKDVCSRMIDQGKYEEVVNILIDLQEELRTISYSDEVGTSVLINTNPEYRKVETASENIQSFEWYKNELSQGILDLFEKSILPTLDINSEGWNPDKGTYESYLKAKDLQRQYQQNENSIDLSGVAKEWLQIDRENEIRKKNGQGLLEYNPSQEFLDYIERRNQITDLLSDFIYELGQEQPNRTEGFKTVRIPNGDGTYRNQNIIGRVGETLDEIVRKAIDIRRPTGRQEITDYFEGETKSNLAKQFDRALYGIKGLSNGSDNVDSIEVKEDVLNLIDDSLSIIRGEQTAGIVEQLGEETYGLDAGGLNNDITDNFTC